MTDSKKRYEAYWLSKRKSKSQTESNRRTPNELLETVASIITVEPAKLLDVGVGVGDITTITRKFDNRVFGCDISENACRESFEKGIITLCADFDSGALPYKSESFDCITCIEVIEHVYDPQNFLRELFRILTKGGTLVLTTPNFRYFRHVSALLFKGAFPHTTKDKFVWGGGHLHYFTRSDLTILLNVARFSKLHFHFNPHQFRRSLKRRLLFKIVGKEVYTEWFCNGIIVQTTK